LPALSDLGHGPSAGHFADLDTTRFQPAGVFGRGI
jgi:hypothetical protein